ncbi:frataxin, mitochondrial isoform X1 [Canna indica]|uniref:ferroxidase n=1 Tax=Canna indica TaxID=4628 RepID=A0AAQ3KAG5_9LILI|nr:frataxin, mitochondrial isoform X1 [Canna indica]
MSSRFTARLLVVRCLLAPRRTQQTSPFIAASLVSTAVASDGGLLSRPMPWSSLGHQCVTGAFFSTRPSALDEGKNPAAIDYRSLMSEEDFHILADETIHDLLEKFEEYGDAIHVDGYEVDYGNHVLTLKLGTLGTYVINKQTPNRQIWLSSPVSGPSRFDCDATTKTWVYRRTKANLLQLLEEEVSKLCGEPLNLC